MASLLTSVCFVSGDPCSSTAGFFPASLHQWRAVLHCLGLVRSKLLCRCTSAAQVEKGGGRVLDGVAPWAHGPLQCTGLCCGAAGRNPAGPQALATGSGRKVTRTRVGHSFSWCFLWSQLCGMGLSRPGAAAWFTCPIENKPHTDEIITVLLSEFCSQLKRKYYIKKKKKKNGSVMEAGHEVVCWDVNCALNSVPQATAVRWTQSARGSAGWGCLHHMCLWSTCRAYLLGKWHKNNRASKGFNCITVQFSLDYAIIIWSNCWYS